MEKKVQIQLRCIFCKSKNFDIPYKSYEPKRGEQFKCANCGRSNDYNSLLALAQKDAKVIAKEMLNKKIQDFQKSLRKMFK